jgi:hypothetical protein
MSASRKPVGFGNGRSEHWCCSMECISTARLNRGPVRRVLKLEKSKDRLAPAEETSAPRNYEASREPMTTADRLQARCAGAAPSP